MIEVINGMGTMLAIIVLVMLLVMVAMAVDLVSGLQKAKARGETRSSWGLKRTLTKFVTYEGAMLIAACMDIIIHLSNLLHTFGVQSLYNVPVVSCVAALCLCIVEIISVYESADAKTKTEVARAGEMVGKVMSNEELIGMLAKAIKAAKDKED